MRGEKRLALLRELTDSTRAGKLTWKAICPGAWDGFVAATPSRYTFTLSRTDDAHWELEVRDVRDEIVDVIGGRWSEAASASPASTDAACLSALDDLIKAVDESTLGPLEDAIGALEDLRLGR